MSTHSARRINYLADLTGAQTYLEIGVQAGKTFFDVDIPTKWAVDPKFHFDYEKERSNEKKFFQETSDSFFQRGLSQTFDIIFLDGLHQFEQTFRDFCNSQRNAHTGTFWLIDDVFPRDVFSTLRERDKALRFRAQTGDKSKAWQGDVFKIVPAIHDTFLHLDYVTLHGDGNAQMLVWQGVSKGRTPYFPGFAAIEDLTYFDLDALAQLFRFEPESAGILKALDGYDAVGPRGERTLTHLRVVREIEYGKAAFGRDNLEDALKHFENAANVKPNHADAHLQMARALNALGYTGKAIDAANRSLTCDPTNADANVLIGNLLRKRGCPSEAKTAYRTAMSAAPGNATGYKQLAELQRQSGELGKAIATLTRFQQAHRPTGESDALLGRLHMDAGDVARARIHAEHALRANPNIKDAHAVLLEVLLTQSGQLEALQHIARYQLDVQTLKNAEYWTSTAKAWRRTPARTADELEAKGEARTIGRIDGGAYRKSACDVFVAANSRRAPRVSMDRDMDAEFPEARLLEMSDVWHFRTGQIFKPGQWALSDSFGPTNGQVAGFNGTAPNLSFNGTFNASVIEEPVIAVSKLGVRNYGHVLVDILPPALWAARQLGPEPPRFMVHKGVPSCFYRTLELFGLGHESIIFHDDAPILCRQLFYPTHWSNHPWSNNPRVFEWIEEITKRVLKQKTREQRAFSRKLFVARDDARTRRLENQKEVENLLFQHGYERVNCGFLSFDEQVAAFSNADEIVSIAGASLTNMIFAPAKCRILCLAPVTMPAAMFWDLAHHKDQSLAFVFGPVADGENHAGKNSDFSAPLNHIRRWLEGSQP